MSQRMNALVIAVFLIVNYVSCRNPNFTQPIQKGFGDPRLYYYYHDRSMLRNPSYLPQDNYDTENVARRHELQQLDRDNRDSSDYRDLCETEKRTVDLTNNPVYDFIPPMYVETFCKSNSFTNAEEGPRSFLQQKCVYPAFHCMQKKEPLVLARRKRPSHCWEPYIIEISSGCDCKWPVTALGEISDHY